MQEWIMAEQGSFGGPLLENDVMRTLVAIAQTGSFTSAASVVGRTPSAVSMQIKKLEETVGRPVFLREGRTVRLTEDGEALLSVARRMLRLNQEAMARFSDKSVGGVVRIGAPSDFGSRILPNILCRFAMTHCSIQVEVHIELSSVLLQAVDRGDLDLTIYTVGSAGEPSEAEILFTERLVWAGLKGGCAASWDPVPVALCQQGCTWRDSAIAALDSIGRRYRVAYTSPHCAGQLASVLADLAVAPWPPSLMSEETVAFGEEDGLPPLGPYHLALKCGSGLTPAAQALAEAVRGSFRDRAVGAASAA